MVNTLLHPQAQTSVCLCLCETDVMATHYAICALSLSAEHGTRPINIALCISDRAAQHLYQTQGRWLHVPLSRLQLDDTV